MLWYKLHSVYSEYLWILMSYITIIMNNLMFCSIKWLYWWTLLMTCAAFKCAVSRVEWHQVERTWQKWNVILHSSSMIILRMSPFISTLGGVLLHRAQHVTTVKQNGQLARKRTLIIFFISWSLSYLYTWIQFLSLSVEHSHLTAIQCFYILDVSTGSGLDDGGNILLQYITNTLVCTPVCSCSRLDTNRIILANSCNTSPGFIATIRTILANF